MLPVKGKQDPLSAGFVGAFKNGGKASTAKLTSQERTELAARPYSPGGPKPGKKPSRKSIETKPNLDVFREGSRT